MKKKEVIILTMLFSILSIVYLFLVIIKPVLHLDILAGICIIIGYYCIYKLYKIAT